MHAPRPAGPGGGPLLGPLILVPACTDGFRSAAAALCAATMIGDASLQALGLYLLVSGARPRPVFVRDPVAHGQGLMSVAARATPGGVTLSVLGAF